jgi:biotin carboxylase
MPHDKALILDASFAALPLIALLKRKYQTLSMGNRPSDPGHALAHEALIEDYSNGEAVLEFCRRQKIQRLIPGVTDISYRVGAYVAENLGFAGFDPLDTTHLLFDKQAFRRYARAHGFPVPKMADTLEEAAALDFPVLVKPADAYSGLGLEKLEDETGLPAAIEKALQHSRKKTVIVEEFVQGSLHAHSAFIHAGQIARDFFVDEFCTVYPWAVNCSHLSHALPKALKKAVRECVTDLARDLRLGDGLLHTQFISRNLDFWLIEITRRCPGDLYGRLIQESCGAPYFSYYLHGFLQEGFETEQKSVRPRHIARHTVSSAVDLGRYAGIRFCPPARVRLMDMVILKSIGDTVRPAPHDRAAVAFLEFEREDRLLALGALLAQYFEILTLESL